MAPDGGVAEPPKKRALPFKRTVARNQQTSVDAEKAQDDNGLDLFRHSNEVFPEVLREAEEASSQKHDRKRRRRSPSSGGAEDSPYSRKGATTPDRSDDDLIMDVKGKGKEVVRGKRPSTPRTPASTRATPARSNSRRTPGSPDSRRGTPRNLARSPVPRATVVIDEEDDADDALPIASPSRPRKLSKPLSESHQEPDSDSDSSVEIVGNAVESELEELKPAADKPDEFSEWVAKARQMQAQSQHAVVKVFLTSPLPGTKPYVVQRRLSQGVQLLLTVWIANHRNEGLTIPDDVANSLFLTWKGNKIYGHSTLASLGVRVDEQGKLRGNKGNGYIKDGIHLEVWTEDAYAEYLQDRGRERARRLGADDDDSPGAESEEEPPPAQQKKGIRMVLKSKEHEPLKLMSKEDTNVEALIEAFRTQRNIGPEWDVSIYFDGERLDSNSLVTDIDIDPDEANQLEVHVKKAGR